MKFVRLLGAALNTGIINVVERIALAEHSFLFKGHLWVLEREKSAKRERRGKDDSQIALMRNLVGKREEILKK